MRGRVASRSAGPRARGPLGSGHLWLSLVALAILVVLAAGVGAGCGKDDPSPGSHTPTAATLTERGWDAFADGDYAQALSAFEQAIVMDAEHGPAHLGAGWAHLAGGRADEDFQAAVTRFDSAAHLGETGAEMLGGRAAAHLALGGDALPAAAADAAAAWGASPDFIFAQWPSFDAADLHLIAAFAEVARARYAEALAVADEVAPSGIDAADPGTWVVGTETCATFARAVLARLEELSESEAEQGPPGGAQ